LNSLSNVNIFIPVSRAFSRYAVEEVFIAGLGERAREKETTKKIQT
jgi:hypothetical protein